MRGFLALSSGMAHVGNLDDLAMRLQRGQKLGRGAAIELRVRGLDAEEETVLARPGELRHVEQRMVELRQAVEKHHSQEGREGAHQDQHFEGDGNEDRPAIVRASAELNG